jgi:hypothetical protein
VVATLGPFLLARRPLEAQTRDVTSPPNTEPYAVERELFAVDLEESSQLLHGPADHPSR